MEGAGHGGRWNKYAPVGTILLLMCMFIPTLTLVQPSEELNCPQWEYLTEKGICCNKCPAGFKLVEMCLAVNHRSNCTPCPEGQYTDQMNYARNCIRCKRCKASNHEVEESPCESLKNTVCGCETGYFKSKIDSEKFECLKCSQCREDQKEKEKCTAEKNTVCGCPENYYRAKGKCEPCKSCSSECEHHCSSTSLTTAPEHGHEFLVNIIAGVAVGAVVLLVLGILITHLYTKRSTQNNMLKPSCHPSDASPDSCEQALVTSEGPADSMSDTAVPMSYVNEQESPNLPDCVPLEIKIPELIYTVLDLVPVLQVKQLVRSLGVKDTEIEQAETDYRPCREAHYQMLRMWAERGSRAGGGRGQDKILHWPLIEELLDKLRKMHLGRAAEELETKYGIQ